MGIRTTAVDQIWFTPENSLKQSTDSEQMYTYDPGLMHKNIFE